MQSSSAAAPACRGRCCKSPNTWHMVFIASNTPFHQSFKTSNCSRDDFLHLYQCLKNLDLDMSHDTNKKLKLLVAPS